MAELADALDSKSSLAHPKWGFDSPLRHWMGEYTVYVLRSLRDWGFYVGITDNLRNRMMKHERGGVRSTKHRQPFVLVYTECCSSRVEARSREKFLKSGPGHQYLGQVVADVLDLGDAPRQERPDRKHQDMSG